MRILVRAVPGSTTSISRGPKAFSVIYRPIVYAMGRSPELIWAEKNLPAG